MPSRAGEVGALPRRAVALAFIACLPCCSPLSQAEIPSGVDRPPPGNYRSIVSENVQLGKKKDREIDFLDDSLPKETFIFKSGTDVANLAISDAVRNVLTDQYGWAWQACLRATVSGAPATLAVFIQNNRIIDARSALVIDECDAMKYTSLAIAPLDARSKNPIGVRKSSPEQFLRASARQSKPSK